MVPGGQERETRGSGLQRALMMPNWGLRSRKKDAWLVGEQEQEMMETGFQKHISATV